MLSRDPKHSIANRLDQDWIDCVEGKAGSVRDADTYPKLLVWAQQTSPSMVLQIGCGQGACSQHVAQADRQFFGIGSSAHPKAERVGNE